MGIIIFNVKIRNITDLKVAIALNKIKELNLNIPTVYFTNFMSELLVEEGVSEMTETQIQEEFLEYINEVNNSCLTD